MPFGSYGASDRSPTNVTPSPSAIRVAASNDYRIDTLSTGYKWGTDKITFSFFAGGTYYGSESSPAPVSEAVKANVRFILADVISPLINVTFTEVPDSQASYGLMRFLCSSSAAYAYAYIPTGGDANVGSSADVPGDVVLNPSNDVVGTDSNSRNNSFQSGPGSHGFTALIHEIGHALGLKHPFESPTMPRAEENQDNTVMTYNFLGGEPATMMPYDILALQYFYGAKTSTRSADTTYTFTSTDDFAPGSGSSGAPSSRFGSMRNTLWDGGGVDAVDLSALPTANGGYRIDIRPGGWIAASKDLDSLTYDGNLKTTSRGTRFPLSGAMIENVVVTRSDDTIYLNSEANLVSGYAPSVSGGADVIYGSDKSDTLDLRQFFRVDVVESQSGNDLAISFGGSGSVTVKDYFAAPVGSRATVLYKDPPPEVMLSGASVVEGNSGETKVRISLTLSKAATQQVSVVMSTRDGTAKVSEKDYLPLPENTTVTFAPGETSQTVEISVRGDVWFEGDETFFVVLSKPQGVAIPDSEATCTIENDDPDIPVLSIADTSISEGNGGQKMARLTVLLSKPSADPVSVLVRTEDGSAEATDGDYIPLAAGTVIAFSPGQISRVVEVPIVGDRTFEEDETFTVVLSDAVGSVIATESAIVTIANDDRDPATLPRVTLFPAVTLETPNSRSFATFRLVISGELLEPVDLTYSTQDGAAKGRRDYKPSRGMLRILPGQKEALVAVAIVDDRLPEADKTFSLMVSAVAGGDTRVVPWTAPLAEQSSATVPGVILDDDSRFITVRSAAQSLTTGEAAAFTIGLGRMAGFGDAMPDMSGLEGLPVSYLASMAQGIRFSARYSLSFEPAKRGGPGGARPTIQTGVAEFGYFGSGDGGLQPRSVSDLELATPQVPVAGTVTARLLSAANARVRQGVASMSARPVMSAAFAALSSSPKAAKFRLR